MTVRLDVADLWSVRDSVPIQRIRVRIYWWPDGEVLRQSHDVMYGVVRDPRWNIADETDGTVSFTVVAERQFSDVPFPPSAIGDEGRFVNAPPEALPHAVPVVYGAVRGLPRFAVSSIAADPIRLIVAGHRIVSTTVQIARDGAAVGAPAAVSATIDALGNPYSYVDIAQASYAAGSNLYAEEVTGWVAPDGSAIDGLGDVLEHLFRTYAGDDWFSLDRPRIKAALPWLNRVRVGFFANDRLYDGTVIRLIETRFMGQFPLTAGFTGGRYGWDSLVLPEDDTDEVQPVASLTYAHDAHTRVGPHETSADDVMTEFDLAYQADGFQAGPIASLHADATNSGGCRRAASRWGEAPLVRMDAQDCPDVGAAYMLLTDQIRKLTVVRDRVEYHGVDAMLYELPPLAVIEVTDSDLGWSARPFLLEAVAPRMDGYCDVVLVSLRGA